MLRIRKNVNTLTLPERANLIAAIKALKSNGKYDQYINEHNAAMNQATLMPGEDPLTPPPQSTYRNVAHRGPAFGPWHREMLRRFELDLQAEVPGVTLPYWDWTADSQLADSKTAPIWKEDLMGGDGDPKNTNLVGTGPFRYDAKDPKTWRVVTGDGEPGPGLRRTLGLEGSLPSQADVDSVLAITPYDKSPWQVLSDPSFRNQLEGWLGPNLHNTVHVWVGGSMLPGTSPNDPVFFLHHCNVDRLWWQWQQTHPEAGYVPTTGGPPGHNLKDQMSPWDVVTTPASTLDIHKLGYAYDSDPVEWRPITLVPIWIEVLSPASDPPKVLIRLPASWHWTIPIIPPRPPGPPSTRSLDFKSGVRVVAELVTAAMVRGLTVLGEPSESIPQIRDATDSIIANRLSLFSSKTRR